MNPILPTDPLFLLTVSLFGFAGCALFGGFLSSIKIMRPITALGTIFFACAGILAACGMFFSLRHSAVLPYFHYPVEVSGLHAFFLMVICLSGIWAAIYNLGALMSRDSGTASAESFFGNLVLASLGAAVMADNALHFLLFLEISALSGYFLTVRNTGDKGERAGQNLLILTQSGVLLISLALWILHSHVPTLTFDTIRHTELPETVRSAVFLLALAGFGVFSGMFPLHGWAPQSHSSASPSAAMLFSSCLMKAGLFGVLLFGVDLLGVPPLWWGIVILLMGSVTAFFGGLYALQEHDIRRLISYHGLENSGIILLGLGAAIAGIALNRPLLTAFGLIGGLYQIFNHSLFSATLLLGAGTVEEKTGLKNIEKMGGLARKMPLTAISILIGLGAMSALPPLNGFVSEWLIYQGLFHFSGAHHFAAHLLGPIFAVGLAVTGTLAVLCAAKVFGVAFLGAARSDAAEHPVTGGHFQTASAFIPAVLCVVFGIISPWLLPEMVNCSGLPGLTHELKASLVCTPLIALLILTLPLLPIILAALYKGYRPPRRVGGTAWACGYDYDKRMNISAHSVAQPIRVIFAPLYGLRNMFPEVLKNHFHGKTAVAFFRGMAAVLLLTLVLIAVSVA